MRSLSSSVPPLYCSKIIYHSWSAFRRRWPLQNRRALRRRHLASGAGPSATDLPRPPLPGAARTEQREQLAPQSGSAFAAGAAHSGSVAPVTFVLPGRIPAKAEVDTHAVFGNKISRWKFSLIFCMRLFNQKSFLGPQNTIFPRTKGLVCPFNDICYIGH